MSCYAVELSQQAASYLRRLGQDDRDRILAKLQELAADPSSNSKRLLNRGGQRSARVGNYRILFDVDSVGKRLLVTTILSRGDVYKHSKK